MSMSPSRRALESVTLADVAKDGRLFVVRCALCRKSDSYLARDLVTVMGPDTPAYGMFGTCRRCGKAEWVSVDMRLPSWEDVGHLKIRRPAGVRTVQLWKEEWYG
jgi:hypothetical protein